MLDINFIKNNVEAVKKNASNKNIDIDVDSLLDLDVTRRQLIGEIGELNAKRNSLAKGVEGGRPSDDHIEEGKAVKKDIAAKEGELEKIEVVYTDLMAQVPNMASDDTPVGGDEAHNKVLRQVGNKPSFDFEPKEHHVLGKELDIIDTETAAKISGPRFAYLKRGLVLLEFALIQYSMSILTSQEKLAEIAEASDLDVPTKPFTPVIPPIFIKPEVYHKMARLEPKEERYHIPTDDLWLIGSAEHTMGPMHMDEVINKGSLPLRYVGFSTAMRREAGSYGKDTKGIFRRHQFDKVEMESFTTPGEGLREHLFFVAIQEYLMKELGIPYQVVLKSTGDMGTPNARAVDIESWMPGQGKYRETHTADYMSDFQARRLNTKVKTSEGTEVAHMNDATVFAMSRTPIAIIENYQTKEGTIQIPSVLQKYMLGVKEIA